MQIIQMVVSFTGQRQRISSHIKHNDMESISLHDRLNTHKNAFHPWEATAYAN